MADDLKKILVFNASEWERGAFSDFVRNSGLEVHLFEERLTESWTAPDHLRDAVAIAVFAGNPVNEKTLAKFPRLTLVATRSTGFDHIDLELCRARGVAVFSVPDYGTITVAEYAIGLIFALLRRFRPLIEQTSHGLLSRQGLRGLDLAGLTVGIVGTGKIGQAVARRLSAFSVRLLGFDVAPDEAFAKTVGMTYVPLEALFRAARIVTFHVPLSESTRHLFNRQTLELVGAGTYLVNTSRGGVVETDALLSGLTDGRLAGVALDTFESEETMMEEQMLVSEQLSQVELRRALATYHLLRSDRVILSPHNAYNTEQALQRIVDTTIENLKVGLAGGTNPNRLT